MADVGLFQDRRVELIEGQVIEMSPMKSSHATGVELVALALRQLFISGYYVRDQKPLVLSDLSEPEPDIAVVTGSIRDYSQSHPTQAVLVVEVSDSTLVYDRKVKGSLYAKATIPEYWILNLIDQTLEVYRDPQPDPEGAFGYSYCSITTYTGEKRVKPLAINEGSVDIADLLP
jgi:Uma2 family endonuclease